MVRQGISDTWCGKTDDEKPATVKIFLEIGHGKKSRDELSKTVNVLKSGIQEEINTVKTTTKNLMMKYESSKKAKKVSKNTKEAQDLEKNKITAEFQQLGQDKLKEAMSELDKEKMTKDSIIKGLEESLQKLKGILPNTIIEEWKPLITARKQKSFYKAKIEHL